MLKIISIALITVFLSAIIKNKSSEISLIVSICGGVLIFMLCFEMLENVVDFFIETSEKLVIDFDIIKLIIKVIGVGYITEFTADIVEDFGNKTIASKVILGGKLVVCGITLPIIRKLFLLLFSFC